MTERRAVRSRSVIRERSRELRREQTEAERELWNGIRGWGIAKFRRQHPLDRFILDFYCPSARLCIEVDGSVHDGKEDRDAARSEVLEARGIAVIRFTNDEVLHDTRGVLHRIKREVRARSPQ
jgi:very-short-patch-repair endonuclease